jgi:hypothetical protein
VEGAVKLTLVFLEKKVFVKECEFGECYNDQVKGGSSQSTRGQFCEHIHFFYAKTWERATRANLVPLHNPDAHFALKDRSTSLRVLIGMATQPWTGRIMENREK